MHSCPDCFQACYCGGDIDDIETDGGAEGCAHFLNQTCDRYSDFADSPDEREGDD